MHAGLECGAVAIPHDQQRQALVVLASQRDYGLTRALPFHALDVQIASQCWKRSQHALDERAVPAIKFLAGIGRIFKTRFQEKKLVLIHAVIQGLLQKGMRGAKSQASERAFRKPLRTFRNAIWNSFPSQAFTTDV